MRRSRKMERYIGPAAAQARQRAAYRGAAQARQRAAYREVKQPPRQKQMLEESVRYMTPVGRKTCWLDARRLNPGPPLVLYFRC